MSEFHLHEDAKLPESIYYQLNHIGYMLRRLRKSKNNGKDFMYGQGKLLILLEEGGLSQKEIINKLGVRQQSVSQLIAKLTKKGLVEKVAVNKKEYQVELTEEGKNVAKELQPAKFEEPDVYSCLSDDEKVELNRLLNKVILHIEDKYQNELEGDFNEKHV